MERTRLSVISLNELNIDLKVSSVNMPKIDVNDFYQHGIKTKLEKFKINDNFKIDSKIEKIYYDKDMKAQEGIKFLYDSKIDENKISKILSVGAMGVKRKLVPTKWSITAVDDSLGKEEIEKIKTFKKGENYRIQTGQFFGNRFTLFTLKFFDAFISRVLSEKTSATLKPFAAQSLGASYIWALLSSVNITPTETFG